MPCILQAIIDGIASTQAAIVFPQTDEEILAEKARWITGKTHGDGRYTHFEGCVGAADGTLVPIMLRDADWSPHAHRSRTAYHLPEIPYDGSRRLTSKELFNLRHSVKRSGAIECAFGLLKMRWRILRRGLDGTRERVHLIINACFHLHNFLCFKEGYGFADVSDTAVVFPYPSNDGAGAGILSAAGANTWRDAIATAMKEDYDKYLDESDRIHDEEDLSDFAGSRAQAAIVPAAVIEQLPPAFYPTEA